MERREQEPAAVPQRIYIDRGSRNESMSIDTMDEYSAFHARHRRPYPPSPMEGGYHQSAPLKQPQQRFPPLPRHPPGSLRSVVTSSFSAEDEREQRMNAEYRHDLPDKRHSEIERRDSWIAYEYEVRRRVLGKPQFREAREPVDLEREGADRKIIKRTYSSPEERFSRFGGMKRNFFHHSGPEGQPGPIPAEFIPPKRAKMSPSAAAERNVVVTPMSRDAARWEERKPGSFDVHDRRHMLLPRTHSLPISPSWSETIDPYGARIHYEEAYVRTPTSRGYSQISPASVRDDAMHIWPEPPAWESHSVRLPPSQFWGPGREWGLPPRGHADRRFAPEGIKRTASMASDAPAYAHETKTPAREQERERTMEPQIHGTPERAITLKDSEKPLLLALPQDKVSLSETLCVVRENIEVFTASQSDVDAPAPGRKHSVSVGQVGLRCIHCRHTTRCSDRVKRAVCYPSSIKRIYRTVIDMKLDHFTQCKYVPDALKNKLNELKAVQTRSTGTTMQYFIRAAHILGMEDGPSGVRLNRKAIEPSSNALPNIVSPGKEDVQSQKKFMMDSMQEAASLLAVKRSDSHSSESWHGSASEGTLSARTDSMISDDAEQFDPSQASDFAGMVPLAQQEDKSALSPLRCFLREQVCAFTATIDDIAVRAPTTFSIGIGQVGIGCIHCVKQPAKLRSNRAVCFPFSIGRIYQSVADIQRFHFGECKMLPPEIKEEFTRLQNASSKGSKGLATRQYWVTSAKKMGLVDTPKGIRFCRDPTKKEASPAFSLDILAQAALSVTTTQKQLVIPEDKPLIAEFLYVVMEQLQPCRFTEADRNKRRLKDVGCIGVECRHCAGQVDSRKFFWSSVNAVESNFVSVHTHMLECRMVPESLKEHLRELKMLRKEQTAALKSGSQKAFFARVWDRLHTEEIGARMRTEGIVAQVYSEEIGARTHSEEIGTRVNVDESDARMHPAGIGAPTEDREYDVVDSGSGTTEKRGESSETNVVSVSV